MLNLSCVYLCNGALMGEAEGKAHGGSIVMGACFDGPLLSSHNAALAGSFV